MSATVHLATQLEDFNIVYIYVMYDYQFENIKKPFAKRKKGTEK